MKAVTLFFIINLFTLSGCMKSSPSGETSEPEVKVTYSGNLSAEFSLVLPNNAKADRYSDINWRFGDGYQSNRNNTRHQYLSPGEYTGTLSYKKNDTLVERAININFDGDNQSVIIQPNKNISIDSDHNDPNQPFLSNNTTPQPLSSPTVLSGILLNANSCQAGRLCDSGDTIDRYLVHLKYGDLIRIEIIKGSIDADLHKKESSSETTSVISTTQIINEYLIPSHLTGEGQYTLDIRLNQSSDSAQYLVHIEPEESISSRYYQPGKLIVLWEDSSNPELIDISDPRLGATDPSRARSSLPDARTALSQQENIKAVSYNYYREAFNADSFSYDDWHWSLQQQNMEKLWSPLASRGQAPGENTTIAVLDTGLYLQHSNLQGLVTHSGYDFVSDPINSGDNNGWDGDPSDPGDNTLSYHGSHVTGIIAAQHQSNSHTSFMQGIAWGAEIMPLRVLGLNGGTSYDLIQALRYAAGLANDAHLLPEKPADIINLSLGGSQFSVAEQATIDEVIQSGAIIVAAAGNQGQQKINYPAAYKDVIAVAATDINGDMAPYSNSGSYIDVAAPGGHCLNAQCDGGIYSLTAMGAIEGYNDSRQASWKSIAGTSMATAHVSGLLAIARSYLPALDAKQLSRILSEQTITSDLNESGFDIHSGWGEIDSEKLLNLMDSSDLNRPSVWINKSELFTDVNQTTNITMMTRGEITPDSLSLHFDPSQLAVSINDDKLNISTLSSFNRHQVVALKLNDETITSINLYPQTNLRMPEYAAHLYLVLNKGSLQTSGLRTVPLPASWQAQTPPLTFGQAIQVSSDIDYDGVYCEMGEFCAYSEYQIQPTSTDVILNGALLGR